MAEPLTSQRSWVDDPDGNAVAIGGISTTVWVRDDNARSVKALCKIPAGPEVRYSLGIERVAYRLGVDELNLPIPKTYLEPYRSQPCSIQVRIGNGRTWRQAEASVLLLSAVTNRDVWPLGVLFDVWMANIDRHVDNFQVEPLPPGTRPQDALEAGLWLTDNGMCGLWPPVKLDGRQSLDAGAVTVGDGSLIPLANTRLADRMPTEYRDSFAALPQTERQPLLDRVAGITDDAIQAAVEEVPAVYFTRSAADKTVVMLRARRDRIATLAEELFPAPPAAP